jgi:hypothetical protein
MSGRDGTPRPCPSFGHTNTLEGIRLDDIECTADAASLGPVDKLFIDKGGRSTVNDSCGTVVGPMALRTDQAAAVRRESWAGSRLTAR